VTVVFYDTNRLSRTLQSQRDYGNMERTVADLMSTDSIKVCCVSLIMGTQISPWLFSHKVNGQQLQPKRDKTRDGVTKKGIQSAYKKG